MSSQETALKATQELKLKEIHQQQTKLKSLQADLEKLNAKIDKAEPLSTDDTNFISELGWLTALSVTIAAAAVAL